MASFFNEILYRPLFNALVYLYETAAFFDLGIAIILLTLIIRFALYPLSKKAIKSQKAMFKIQPEIRELQEKYKDNKEELMKRTMALYKERGVNPFSGCLPILIQLPILIALYWVFLAGFDSENLDSLYSFVSNPGDINYVFLGSIDISQRNFYIALIAGFFQYIQSKMLLDQQLKGRREREMKLKKENKKETPNKMDDLSLSISKQMTYFMPIVTIFFAASFQAGIAIYWATTTIFSVVQQWYVFKKTEDK